jgi:uncharacterized protein YbcI
MEVSSAVLGTSNTSKELARTIAALHKQHLGKGPKTVKCYVHDDCVLVLMYEGHTSGEATLQNGGEGKEVAKQRVLKSAAIDDELIAAVETATERKVITCMSSSKQDPSLLSLVFVLEPTDLFDG